MDTVRSDRARDRDLGLDGALQDHAREALEAGVRANGGVGGALLALDPASGEILACATSGSLARDDQDSMPWGSIISEPFELGSVKKVIPAAAVIEERLFPLDRTFGVPDRIDVGGHLFRDVWEHPEIRMTLADVLVHSSNVGMIKIAARLGPHRLARYLRRFGLGAPTGIGVPGEASGTVPPVGDWVPSDRGAIPIGYGVTQTLLQMAMAFSVIANGGLWAPPRLRGAPEPPGGTASRRRIVSEATARALTEILCDVVKTSRAKRAQVTGFWVAGKTGTAFKRDAEGRYIDKHHASFFGFLPALSPRMVMGVLVDEPATVFGSSAAAPIFRDVAGFAMRRFGEPTSPRPSLPPRATDARGRN